MRSYAQNRENGDLEKKMGTKNLIKVPMGTRVPKWGPTWEQCILMEIFQRKFQIAGPVRSNDRQVMSKLETFQNSKAVLYYDDKRSNSSKLSVGGSFGISIRRPIKFLCGRHVKDVWCSHRRQVYSRTNLW